MSGGQFPTLGEVELPTAGSWVTFREARDTYVLRADPEDSWTLLSVRGDIVGTFHRHRETYRTRDAKPHRPAITDWRQAVRSLCATPDPPGPAAPEGGATSGPSLVRSR